MIRLLTLSGILILLLSCQDQPTGQIETWWVNSAKVECIGVGPVNCLQISKEEELDRKDWELFYSTIEGFDYEPGFIYRLGVEIEEKEEPSPADASSKRYKLLKILSKEMDPALQITNIWKVIEVGEIKDPKGFKNGETLTFEFNASGKTYFGNMGCNTVRGQIKENDGETLILGPGASTKMACPDMSVENAISKALIDTRKYKIENRELHLMNEADEILMKLLAVD
ncbi:DUF4377 domain-containing protein [Algoriphagus marincola]|uniref:DUF4377 domain-containing protein n=1 Tax=Algoriphagus marincola TaxID=264027 RepID=A0ABS7MZS2_9BACT|nr:DUF4377 domain-containing protein [Algoriphagus marincola]MBY5949559.1 DUF4377 domain-containing protein [Algoriphagus marincola]